MSLDVERVAGAIHDYIDIALRPIVRRIEAIERGGRKGSGRKAVGAHGACFDPVLFGEEVGKTIVDAIRPLRQRLDAIEGKPPVPVPTVDEACDELRRVKQDADSRRNTRRQWAIGDVQKVGPDRYKLVAKDRDGKQHWRLVVT